MNGINQINYKRKNYGLIITSIIIVAALIFGYFDAFEYIGNIVGPIEFDLNETWTPETGIVRFSLNSYVKDTPLNEVIKDNKIIINLEEYNISEAGDAYIDILISGTIVDSKKIVITQEDLALPSEQTVETPEETISINETTEEINITIPEESNSTLEIEIPEIIETPNITEENITIPEELTLKQKGKSLDKVLTKTDKGYDLTLKPSEETITASELNKETEIRIKGIKNKDVTSFLDKVDDTRFTTDVFALSKTEIEEATLTLPKYGQVNLILKCPEFNPESGYCPSWIRTNIPFTDNGNSITFNVDSFSGYVGSNLILLNIKSYPQVGDNWEVNFETIGTADLTIEAVDGTSFGEDLEFINLYCGSNVITSSLTDGKIFVPGYSCSEDSKEVSRVISTGQHVLLITFGSESAKAYNYASDFPQILNIHGKLTDSAGVNVDTETTMTFRIYNTYSGGAGLWEETLAVPVSNGIYSITLGHQAPVNLTFDTSTYLGITVAGDSEMAPRINLTSSPYAFVADHAYNLSCTDCVDWNSEIENIPDWLSGGSAETLNSSAWNRSDSGIVTLANPTDKVGIGNEVPTHDLNVEGDTNLTGNLYLDAFETCTLKTVAGTLVCGEDNNTAASGDLTNVAFVNNTQTFTLNQTIEADLNLTGVLYLDSFATCTLKTVAGALTCGTDNTGAGDDLTNVAFLNNSQQFTSDTRFSKSPVFQNLTSCDTIDTDSDGNLACGTDSGSTFDDTAINTTIEGVNNTIVPSADLNSSYLRVGQNETNPFDDTAINTTISGVNSTIVPSIDLNASYLLIGENATSGVFDDTAVNSSITSVNDTLVLAIAAQAADNTTINTLVSNNNASLTDIITKVVPSSDINASYPTLKGDNTFTLSPVFANLTSCDTIDTDASGNLACGDDASSAGGMVYTNLAMINESNEFIENQTINAGLNITGLLYLDAFETCTLKTVAGTLSCGSDLNTDDLTNIAFVNNTQTFTLNQTIEADLNLTGVLYLDSFATCTLKTVAGALTCGTDSDTGANLPENAINTTHIIDGTITNVDISNSAAIDPSKIVNGTFGSTDDYVFPANLNVTNNLTAEGITIKTNDKIYLGDEGDAMIYFDGTDLIFKVN
ncbi:MAG: hypothetical protein PHE43_04370 [Candidatus Nanoarchaeia archaeon]|nr:hypothetical protein [Candidatus Nanoarchaeia archaeon]